MASPPGWGSAGDLASRLRAWLGRSKLRSVAIGAVGLLAILIAVLFITAPLSKSLQPITTPSLTLLSAEGLPIARRGAVVEAAVDASKLPDDIVLPFLAIEDRRFHSHIGIDPQGIGRALLSNLRSGAVVEGGSTITQQLAKLAFLSPERTLWRKLQEMVLALWLEARLGKNEILSRYLSSVYFGDNVFGLRAAARHYFSRNPEQLSVEQAAMLAGLLKAPSSLAPTKNLDGARRRTQTVLRAMVAAEMLSETEASALPEAKLKLGGLKEVPTGSYFADWVAPQVAARIDYKYPAHTIRTTLEDRLQRHAVGAIRKIGTGGAQVALVAMRRDGRIVAMVGGKSYKRSPFNRATQALRQPGSTFKLFVYMTALQEGYTPQSPILDLPVRIGSWSPDNYGERYRGPITLHEAFAVSSNVAAVRLAEDIGRDNVATTARDLGITGELEPGPTMTLGTSGIPLIELVGAYAAVAAGRYPVTPRGLPGRSEDDASSIPMDETVRGYMLELLSAVVNEGSGRAARLAIPTFGKTGTSQGSRDAYFIGFAGHLITGVWIGYDDNRPMRGAQGGGIPASIWRAFMSNALRSYGKPVDGPSPRPLPLGPADTWEPSAIIREYDVEEWPVGQDAWLTEPLDGQAEPGLGDPGLEPPPELPPTAPEEDLVPSPPPDDTTGIAPTDASDSNDSQ